LVQLRDGTAVLSKRQVLLEFGWSASIRKLVGSPVHWGK
jgi:hypothetical protein